MSNLVNNKIEGLAQIGDENSLKSLYHLAKKNPDSVPLAIEKFKELAPSSNNLPLLGICLLAREFPEHAKIALAAIDNIFDQVGYDETTQYRVAEVITRIDYPEPRPVTAVLKILEKLDLHISVWPAFNMANWDYDALEQTVGFLEKTYQKNQDSDSLGIMNALMKEYPSSVPYVLSSFINLRENFAGQANPEEEKFMDALIKTAVQGPVRKRLREERDMMGPASPKLQNVVKRAITAVPEAAYPRAFI